MSRPIDVHAHFVPPSLIAALEREGPKLGVWIKEDEQGGKRARFADDFRTYYSFFPGLTDLDARFARQERMGIGLQVLSGWMDMVGYGLEPRNGQALSRLANEAGRRLIAGGNARRLLGLAAPATSP